MTAAIICARGGSKRLPRKNVRPFCGLPLVAWSIIQAKNSHGVDWVYLSTDDDEIEAIGTEYGAEVIRRPDWPDADQVSAMRPMRHAIGVIQQRHPDFDTLVTVLPTMPFRYPDEIDRSIAEYNKRGRGLPLYALSRNYETQILEEIRPGIWTRIFYSRDTKYLSQTGCLTVASIEGYLKDTWPEEEGDHDTDITAKYEAGYKEEAAFIELQHRQWVDTDTVEDFEFGELLFEHFLLKGRGRAVYDDYGTGT